MTGANRLNYARIEKAIQLIVEEYQSQPNLEDIAKCVGLSPYHFQRLFKEWAGVSPKKFTQYLSLEHAKHLLRQRKSLLETAHDTGLSGTGRLHDLFVAIEKMTPGEFKNGGANLCIRYSFTESPFGTALIASTPKGVCYLAFIDNPDQGLKDLVARFPKANFNEGHCLHQHQALSIFQLDWQNTKQIKLHLAGTPFQLKVWECLIQTPFAALTTYGELATQTGKPTASRAVGTAVGRNPVAFVIPCHRVIQSTGKLGGYMWGPKRKAAMIAWETAKNHTCME